MSAREPKLSLVSGAHRMSLNRQGTAEHYESTTRDVERYVLTLDKSAIARRDSTLRPPILAKNENRERSENRNVRDWDRNVP